eukprot:Rmarinus@m.27438
MSIIVDHLSHARPAILGVDRQVNAHFINKNNLSPVINHPFEVLHGTFGVYDRVVEFVDHLLDLLPCEVKALAGIVHSAVRDFSHFWMELGEFRPKLLHIVEGVDLDDLRKRLQVVQVKEHWLSPTSRQCPNSLLLLESIADGVNSPVLDLVFVADRFEAHKKACFDCSSMVHIGSVSSEDFFSAVAEGYFACVRYISDVTCEEFTLETDDESWTVLHHATTLGRLDMIRYFIEEKGASSLMTHFDVEGKTVLHYAAIAGRLDIFRYFVERGASYIVAGVDKAGWSALHLAGWYGCAHVVRYVVERLGVMSLSTATYDKGETVLHHAAGRGHIEIVRYVVERGATGLLEQENNMGETALGVARKSPYSNKRVVDYLFSKM